MIIWGSTIVTAVKWGSTACTQVKWGSTVVFPTDTNLISYRSAFNQGMYHSVASSEISYNNEGSISSTAWTCTARVFGDNSGSTKVGCGSHYGIFVSKSTFNASLYSKITFKFKVTPIQAHNSYTWYFWAGAGVRWIDTNSFTDPRASTFLAAPVHSESDYCINDLNNTSTISLTNKSFTGTGNKYLLIECVARAGQNNTLAGATIEITEVSLLV